jgi:uncharacterized protein
VALSNHPANGHEVAERQGITRILTLDRRDFGMVLPRHATHFDILP